MEHQNYLTSETSISERQRLLEDQKLPDDLRSYVEGKFGLQHQRFVIELLSINQSSENKTEKSRI